MVDRNKITQDAVFHAQGFLKSSRLDKEGAKTITIEFSAKDALPVAKLELMGRDHVAHLPVLLDVRIKVAKDKTKKESPSTSETTTAPRQRHNIARVSA